MDGGHSSLTFEKFAKIGHNRTEIRLKSSKIFLNNGFYCLAAPPPNFIFPNAHVSIHYI